MLRTSGIALYFIGAALLANKVISYLPAGVGFAAALFAAKALDRFISARSIVKMKSVVSYYTNGGTGI